MPARCVYSVRQRKTCVSRKAERLPEGLRAQWLTVLLCGQRKGAGLEAGLRWSRMDPEVGGAAAQTEAAAVGEKIAKKVHVSTQLLQVRGELSLACILRAV